VDKISIKINCRGTYLGLVIEEIGADLTSHMLDCLSGELIGDQHIDPSTPQSTQDGR